MNGFVKSESKDVYYLMATSAPLRNLPSGQGMPLQKGNVLSLTYLMI